MLHIGASEHLMASMRRVLSALVGRQKNLAEGRRMRTDASVDFQASDTAKFWLLHTVNSYVPMTLHMVDHGVAHPEDCYQLLGNMIGEFCTFDADGDPTSIPKFNYLELTDVFEPMIERVIRQITGVPSRRAAARRSSPWRSGRTGCTWESSRIPSSPRTHELFLEAKGADEGILRERLPRLLKIGSWTQIGYILNAAMPGVRVGVEYRPPGAIPVKPGLVYLRVDQAGDYWNDILGSGTIAIYQPIDPQKVDLRLIAVQASK